MGRRQQALPSDLQARADAQLGLLTTAQCAAAGLDFRGRRRRVLAGAWSEPAPGVLDTRPGETQEVSVAQRRAVEVSLLASGPDAVAVGLAALRLHGCWALPMHWDAHAVRASRRRGRGGAQNDDFVVVEVAQRRAASVPWAIVQALPRLGRLHVVAILDWALNQGHIASVDEILRLGAGHRWIRKVREWGQLADGRAESILETWARLQCIDAGIPPTTLQLPIQDADGRVRARGDLAWRLPNGRWLVVEIDGAQVHDQPISIRRDRRRHNWAVSGGSVTVLRYDASDLRQEGYLPSEVHSTFRKLAAAA